MKQALLSVRDLSYLGNGPYSFDLPENHLIGLTGASGVGKTQMLRSVVDAIEYTGDVLFKGQLSQQFEAPQWRRKVALVPAESAWWRDRVGEHFPRMADNSTDSSYFDVLGFDADILTWRIARLSTGEKQRLALIRALVLNPEVLLVDEPCSALDEKSVSRVEKLLSEYVSQPGKGIIWVSHDLQQLHRVADSCFRVLKDELTVI